MDQPMRAVTVPLDGLHSYALRGRQSPWPIVPLAGIRSEKGRNLRISGPGNAAFCESAR
jgi:hypothetical protein